MRILFLSQLLPYPPDAGAKIRSYHVLQWLAQKHEVTLLAFSRPDDTLEATRHLEELCKRVVLVPLGRSQLRDMGNLIYSLMADQSFIIRRDGVRAMREAVGRAVEQTNFAAVHADQLWMAQYALQAKKHFPGLQAVLDEHNACFEIFERLADGEANPLKRWLWQREAHQLKRYESAVCRQFDRVVTVTEGDQRTLADLSGGEAFSTIPICVDTRGVQAVPARHGMKGVLHLGTMFWPPNVEGMLWFTRQVWPKVVAQVPSAQLTIVGKNPPPEIQKLAADHRQVEVTGYVNEVSPYIQMAGVFVVPLWSGGGMRVKIIDAWRWGLPVVSTQIGAEGIDYRHGENILIADGEDAFAEAVVQVLRDEDLAMKLRVEGRRWVEDQYEWTSRYAAWDEVYRKA